MERGRGAAEVVARPSGGYMCVVEMRASRRDEERTVQRSAALVGGGGRGPTELSCLSDE